MNMTNIIHNDMEAMMKIMRTVPIIKTPLLL